MAAQYGTGTACTYVRHRVPEEWPKRRKDATLKFLDGTYAECCTCLPGTVMATSRLIIVDDHALFRGALGHALSSVLARSEIDEAGSLDDLMAKLKAGAEPDLILLDLTMPGVNGLSGLLYLRAERPEIPVVVVSASDDPPTIRRCLEFGAAGYVPKSQTIERIRDAVRTVLDGGVWTPPGLDLDESGPSETRELAARLSTLTPQQVRVLSMLEQGFPNKEIAYQLGVSEATIKAHVSAILQKLGVHSRTQAVIAVKRLNSNDGPRAVATPDDAGKA